MDVSVGLSAGKPVGFSVVPRLAVEIAVKIAVEIAAEIAMASVRGFSWNAVGIAVECRGGLWTLPRCSAKKINNVHPSITAPKISIRSNKYSLVLVWFIVKSTCVECIQVKVDGWFYTRKSVEC